MRARPHQRGEQTWRVRLTSVARLRSQSRALTTDQGGASGRTASDGLGTSSGLLLQSVLQYMTREEWAFVSLPNLITKLGEFFDVSYSSGGG